MTFTVNVTYWVVTLWYQFIDFTICSCDCLRTVIHNCIVVFTYWLVFFIHHWSLDCVTIFIYIVNVYITLRLSWLFFKFVDISNVFTSFNHFTSCSIWWLKVTLSINFTYSVVTGWYQFICLTIVLDFIWTVVYYCIVVFINWLIFFINNWSLNCVTFSVFIVNVNITLHFFVNVSDDWTWFINFTFNWIRWF